MLKIRSILLIICTFIILTDSIQSQTMHSSTTLSTDSLLKNTAVSQRLNRRIPRVLRNYILSGPARNPNGTIIPDTTWIPLDESITFQDTMFYDPSFLPIVFDGKILPADLDFRQKDTINTEPNFHLISPDSTFVPYLTRNKQINQIRKNFYLNPEHFEKIRYSKREFSQITPIFKEPIAPKKKLFEELITAENPVQVTSPTIEKYEPKRLNWVVKGEHSLQIAQNHISDNWYKGGNSSFYVKSYQKFTFNYKKDKVTFNNMLEWKLGLQNSSGDTLRDVSINDDLIRTYSVFGYKAFNKWSYSTTLEIKTQIFNTYPENKTTLNAAFLAPLDINAGIGMTYTLDKKFENHITKRVKLALNLSPISVNFRYIGNDKVDETKFKLEKGKKTKTDLGSLVNADLTFNFNSFVTWTSRFKYFTDYESVVSELENKVDFSLNRYFSTSLYLYLRYDETSKKDDKLKYFQYNELLSFGLNYKW